MLQLCCHLESSSPSDKLLNAAKGSLAFAGRCWAGEYVEGPALQGREGFFYIWLTPPDYRIRSHSGRDNADSRFGRLPGTLSLQYGASAAPRVPLPEVGRKALWH